MALSDDLGRIAAAAAAFGRGDEQIAAVLAIETAADEHVYLCAFTDAAGNRTWLLIDEEGSPITDRERVREAASIAALVELAEESLGAGTEELRVASLPYLDSLGGNGTLAGAIQGALPAVDELTRDVEANYRLELT